MLREHPLCKHLSSLLCLSLCTDRLSLVCLCKHLPSLLCLSLCMDRLLVYLCKHLPSLLCLSLCIDCLSLVHLQDSIHLK